jgi:hypothetical protein
MKINRSLARLAPGFGHFPAGVLGFLILTTNVGAQSNVPSGVKFVALSGRSFGQDTKFSIDYPAHIGEARHHPDHHRRSHLKWQRPESPSEIVRDTFEAP